MATLLEMSITGGVLIAVIIIVRALAINRLPKAAFLVLWAVALCRLLLPFYIPSPTSIYTTVSGLDTMPQRPGVLISGQEVTATAETAGPSFTFFWALWIAGGILLAGTLIVFHLRSRRRYAASLPLEDPFIKDCLEAHRIRRPVQVRCSDQIESPLTYGILWPVILLPKKMLREDEQRLSFVLAHEMAHIRRFDVLTKWLLATTLCIHWFNPLVWAMYLLANRDLELSCDEHVVLRYGRDARSSYALTLVEMEELRAHFTPLASSFSKNALKERITAIMKTRPLTVMSCVTALLLVAAIVGVFATTAPMRQAPPAEQAVTAQGNQGPVRQKSASTPQTVENHAWDGEWEDKPSYTQAQYEQLIGALKFEGYEDMSIAEFNRKVHSVLNEDNYNENSLPYIYEIVLMSLPDTDPNAAFLRNTVQASLTEYRARLSEAFSNKKIDPEFEGAAEYLIQTEVFGDIVTTGHLGADYSFTYRILDQDHLTVRERDAFLQNMMQTAQSFLEENVSEAKTEDVFKEALSTAGKNASNEKISFTGCQVYDLSNRY